MFLDSYERLNSKQKHMVDTDWSFAIHAGPGCGKTEVLALKAVRLLEQVVPVCQNVAVVTYANEMVKEMLDRLRVLGNLSFDNLFVGTVHSFCLQQVIIPFAKLLSDRPIPFKVAGEIECDNLWRKVVGNDPDRAKRHRTTILDRESQAWQNDPLSKTCLEYERILTERGKIDFDGMFLHAYWMLKDHPSLQTAIRSKFPWLLIDEYQDLSHPFRELVYLLLRTDINIIAVGDPNQAIYSPLNEDTIQILLAKAREVSPARMYEESFDVSYRCPENLLRIAGSIIGAQSITSEAKTPAARIAFKVNQNSSARAVQIVQKAQARSVESKDRFLIAHPVNRQIGRTRELVTSTLNGTCYFDIWSTVNRSDRLLKYNPFVDWLQRVSHWCTQSPTNTNCSFLEIFDTWLYMTSPCPTNSLDSSILARRRIEFFKTLMHLRITTTQRCGDWLDECRRMLDIESVRSIYEDSEDYQRAISFLFDQKGASQHIRNCSVEEFASHCSENKAKLSLLTVHASKGLEFDYVIVVGIEHGPGRRTTFPNPLGTEIQQKRLLYTILTRARKGVLFVSHTNQLPILLERVKQAAQENNTV
jgi:DNA helicase-2/ATP-dependent DNA helicase PcrA